MHKKTLEEFRTETQTIEAQAEFTRAEQLFQDNHTLTKIQKNSAAMNNQYSYIWYEDPETNKKIAIRMTNKTINKYILGLGASGIAKYGVDKNGKLYAIKIQHNTVDSYGIQNANNASEEIKAQILSGNANPPIQPQTFILIDNILYFQAEPGTFPIRISRPPTDDSTLTETYDKLVQYINEQLDEFPNIQHTQSHRPFTSMLTKFLVIYNIPTQYDPLNKSMSLVEETEISFDVHLAHGKKTRRTTTAFALQVMQVDDDNMEYGNLYIYCDANGHIAYKTLDINRNIIDTGLWPFLPSGVGIFKLRSCQRKQTRYHVFRSKNTWSKRVDNGDFSSFSSIFI